MASIIEFARLNYSAEQVVKEMTDLLHTRAGFGVTRVGTIVTMRWGAGKKLMQVSMVIVDVDDGEDEPHDSELEK